jgi:hypothetical protein
MFGLRLNDNYLPDGAIQNEWIVMYTSQITIKLILNLKMLVFVFRILAGILLKRRGHEQ